MSASGHDNQQRDPVSGHVESEAAVIGHAASFAPGASVPWHRHRRGQLALTLARVMRVETPDKVWLVPRGAVLWLPAGTPHRSLAPEQRLMRSLYVLPDAAGALPAAPTAVEQGTPLADMLTWLAETYDSDRLDKAWSTVAGAALALVRPAPGLSIRLPRPADPALAVIADAVLADPAEDTGLEDWGQRLGVGARTLRRRVQAETGLSYRDWRRILGLTVAAERLLAGGRVTDVAFETGYAGTSAFVAAFRAAFQVTPGELQRRAALRGTAPRGISGL